MKKKITMILMILISIVFLNDRVNASVMDYAPWVDGMKDCNGNNLSYDEYNYGGYYQTYKNGKMCFSLNNKVTTPSSSNKLSFYVKLKGDYPDYEINSNNVIYNLNEYYSVQAFWQDKNDSNNFSFTRCYAQEFDKKNTSVYYTCDIMNTKYNYQLSSIDIIGYEKTGSTLESFSYIGISGVLNFLSDKINSSDLNEINQNQQQTNNILTQDHNYNQNESQSTQGQKEQMENYEKEEDNLRNNLNLSIEEAEVTIKPEANTFIWEIVNKLRTMSGKIVLLFTSVLSLGIMKMILGR